MDNVVWEDQLDGRFNCWVERDDNTPYSGTLYVADALQRDRIILTENVAISFGAPLGVDVGDVENWSSRVIDFIDSRYYG